MNKLSQPNAFNERVLFRTHTEMLTDQRIIIRGESYPLAQIERAYVRAAWYYAPFLFIRLLIGLAAALFIMSYLGIIDSGVVPGSQTSHLIGGILGGVFVATITGLVPTHNLWIRTTSGQRELMMRSTHAGHLRDVLDQIDAARRARQDMIRPAAPATSYAPKLGVSR